jgi:hypothetical protein
MSQEVTIMKLRTLFEKRVFVRLSEDHSAFICTTKWPLLSITRRVGIHDEAERDVAPQVREPGLIASEQLPVLWRSAVEPDRTQQTAEFERRIDQDSGVPSGRKIV